MSADKSKKAKTTTKGQETEGKPGDGEKHGGAHGKAEWLDTIRQAASAAIAKGMETLRTELKRDLQEFSKCFREDIKKLIDKFTRCDKPD